MRATSGVMSRTMPVMAAIDNMRAEKASMAPSLSSCMSFWYARGSPFITISSASSAPMMRPVLARTSSAASGLRFCGMMEEPLVKRSESLMRPTSGERRGAERTKIRALARIGEPAAVARGHFHIGEKVVPEGDGLRRLQMGEAWHHGGGVFERLLRERALVGGERRIDGIDRGLDPQPETGRDLVVARARGVQPPRRRPDQLGEPAFHVHMDVLE